MLDWGLHTEIICLLMFWGSKIQCMIWSKISTVFHFCGHDSFRAYRINQQNTYSKRRFGPNSSVLMIDNLRQFCWDDSNFTLEMRCFNFYDLTKKKLSPAIGINDHECYFVGPIHILKHKIQWLCWNSFDRTGTDTEAFTFISAHLSTVFLLSHMLNFTCQSSLNLMNSFQPQTLLNFPLELQQACLVLCLRLLRTGAGPNKLQNQQLTSSESEVGPVDSVRNVSPVDLF